MNKFKLLVRVFKKIRKPWKTTLDWYRLFLLQYRASWYGGQILFGDNLQINQAVIFQGKGVLRFGDNVILGYPIGGAPTLPILLQPRETDAIIQIGHGSTLVNGTEMIARSRISLGDNCLVGARCVILDADFHGLKPYERTKGGRISPVEIGNNVWLGLGSMILKGVHIGDDAVVGAGCVVTKSVPAGGIVVGNPMKILGSVYDE